MSTGDLPSICECSKSGDQGGSPACQPRTRWCVSHELSYVCSIPVFLRALLLMPCRIPQLVGGGGCSCREYKAGGEGSIGSGEGAPGNAAAGHQGPHACGGQGTEPPHGARRSELSSHLGRAAYEARHPRHSHVPRWTGGGAQRVARGTFTPAPPAHLSRDTCSPLTSRKSR